MLAERLQGIHTVTIGGCTTSVLEGVFGQEYQNVPSDTSPRIRYPFIILQQHPCDEIFFVSMIWSQL